MSAAALPVLPRLFLVMARPTAIAVLLGLSACGGFTTPEATAEVAYTISSPLPLLLTGSEHRLHLLQAKLVLRGLEARVEGGAFVPVSPTPLVVDVGRTGRVVVSQSSELTRGDYVELRVGLYRLDPQVSSDRPGVIRMSYCMLVCEVPSQAAAVNHSPSAESA